MTQLLSDTRLVPTVPGPKGNLFWGSLREFRRDSLGFLADSAQRYGDIVRFRFGPVVAFLVNHPDYVEHVLNGQPQRYDKHTWSVSKIRATCGNSLLSSDGEPWLRHRRLIQPVFQPQKVAKFLPVIDSATDEMLRRWSEKASCGQELDIVSEMMRLTMTIAAEVFFGSDIRNQTARIEQALTTILEDTWRRLETALDWAAISPWFHRRSFSRAVRQVDDVVYQIIAERRQNGLRRDDLLSRLLRAHDANEGTHLTDRELRDAVVTLLLAGHETTANALASAFYLISQSAQTQDRLVTEASQRTMDGQPCEVPEARKSFLEAIRIYPSIWIIERRAMTDDQIGGYPIPRGATVLVSPYLLHRHLSFWEDPERYDPDRFSLDRVSVYPRCAYVPFGLGPHRCIGEHMALLVATRILSRVHRDFRLRLAKGQGIRLIPGITLRHNAPLQMTLEYVDSPRAY